MKKMHVGNYSWLIGEVIYIYVNQQCKALLSDNLNSAHVYFKLREKEGFTHK